VRERKVEAQNQKVHILARERCHKCGVSEKKISKEKERESKGNYRIHVGACWRR